MDDTFFFSSTPEFFNKHSWGNRKQNQLTLVCKSLLTSRRKTTRVHKLVWHQPPFFYLTYYIALAPPTTHLYTDDVKAWCPSFFCMFKARNPHWLNGHNPRNLAINWILSFRPHVPCLFFCDFSLTMYREKDEIV